MLASVSLAKSMEEGSQMISEALNNGSALEKFGAMLRMQGVDSNLVENLTERSAKRQLEDYLEIMGQKAKHVTSVM